MSHWFVSLICAVFGQTGQSCRGVERACSAAMGRSAAVGLDIAASLRN
ncbi:unnamed protein product [Acidocella sp. C78]|nr:unnamed protein product [Acidocella sp. C78]